MTSTQRRLLAGLATLIVALVATVAVLVASDDDPKVASRRRGTASSTTSEPAPTTAQQPTTTVGIVCPTPDNAAMTVFDGWKNGNQAAAAPCASQTALDTLFANPGADAQWTFMGCDTENGTTRCYYRYEGGSATFTMGGSDASGWRVDQITYVAD